jgi:hypothetical protein
MATGKGESDRKPPRHVEHFWLCGACSKSLTLTQGARGIDLIRKLPSILERGDREFRDAESVAAGVPF